MGMTWKELEEGEAWSKYIFLNESVWLLSVTTSEMEYLV